MVTIIAAIIAGFCALLAAVISISKHRSNHVREFNNSLEEYEMKFYRNYEIREIYRDRAAESLLNMKGVKAKIVDLFFYDEKLEQKAYLVTKYRFYLKVSSDYSDVKINKVKLNLFSVSFFLIYSLFFSYVSWQFLNFNKMIVKFNNLFEKGDLLSILNWIVWDFIILTIALFCMFMCVRIQELRILEKSSLYKILF
ncbi:MULTISPECIES: hypothetical protein [unclassified Acinetobacter]|nr:MULTISPECIES: hypothetical protein [unclassified Acinetobacter]